MLRAASSEGLLSIHPVGRTCGVCFRVSPLMRSYVSLAQAAVTKPRDGGGGGGLSSEHPSLTVLEAGHPRSRHHWPPGSERAVFSPCPPVAQQQGAGAGSALWSHPLLRALTNPIPGPTLLTSSKPKTPPPNTITLGVRAPTHGFWGDTDIQSTARIK